MEHQARSRVRTGATVVAHRPPIPPAIKRNTLLLAVTQAFVGVGNQMVPALGAMIVLQLLGSPALAGIATGTLGGCRFLVAYPIGALHGSPRPTRGAGAGTARAQSRDLWDTSRSGRAV